MKYYWGVAENLVLTEVEYKCGNNKVDSRVIE